MDCIGIVLAGGQSRRMGTDKAGLLRQRTTMLSWTRHCLAQCCEQVVVSGPARKDAIEDCFAGYGPLSGLHAVARRFPEHALLAVPVDMPRLSVPLLTRLLYQGGRCRRSVHYRQHYLPLFFTNRPAERAALEQRLADGEKLSVRDFCQQQNALAIDPTQPHQLTNCNTPQQWQAAMAEIHQENT